MLQEQRIDEAGDHLTGTPSGRGFAVLFALARSGRSDSGDLRTRLGLGEPEYDSLVGDLENRRLLTVSGRGEGRTVRLTLRLTEKGEKELVRLLEQMCELPEKQ